MTPEVCKVKIEELEELQISIAQRIKELRDHAGLAIGFYEQLSAAKDDILRLMEDRFDEDDDDSVWCIITMLRGLEDACIKFLRPRQPA